MSERYLQILLSLVVFISIATCLTFQNTTSVDIPIAFEKIAYSPNQKYLFIGGSGSNNQSFLISDGLRPANFDQFTLPNNDIVQSVAFSPNNTYLAIGDRNGGINLYTSQNNSFKKDPQVIETNVNNQVNSVAFSKDGNLIAAGLANGIISIIDVEAKNPIRNLTFGNGRAINTLTFSPANNQLLVVGGVLDSAIMVLDTTNGDIKYQKNFTSNCKSGVFSFDGSKFYANTGPILLVYDANSYISSQNVTIAGQTNLEHIQISKNNKYLTISGAQVNILKVQLLQTNQPALTSAKIYHALGSDAGSLVVGASVNQINIYQLCPQNGQFYSSEDVCDNCQPPCANCIVSAAFCQSCIQRYFFENNICTRCISGCIQCQNSNQCQTCDTAANFYLDIDKTCKCNQGYFPDGQDICSLCMTGCIRCSQVSICQICNQEKFFQLNATTNKCQCKSAYRQQDTECIHCEKGCLSCDAQKCTNCDNQNHWIDQIPAKQACKCNDIDHFVEKAGACLCNTSYFLSNNKCQRCQPICSQCTAFQICTNCINGAVLVDSMCQCPSDQFFNVTTVHCDSCDQKIFYCIKCQSADKCDLCDDTKNRILVSNKCVCKESYYEDEDKNCLQCGIPGCLNCNNTQVCIKCNSAKHWYLNQENLCDCQLHYFQKDNACISCIDGCLTCSQEKSCQKCDEKSNWHLENDTICYCNEGHYDSHEQVCKLCSRGCKQCTSAEFCQQCYTENHFQPNQVDNQTCICESGYYNSSWTICLKCDLSACLECSNQKTCTNCYQGFDIKDGLCKCPDEKYADGNKCQNCESPCLLCKSKDQCQSCIDGYDLDGSKCQKGGISAVVIILIVVGCLALIGAGVAIIKFCRKKKAASILEQQGEYQPVS